MTDIVERLRACPGLDDPECNCAEAADEIERLTAFYDEGTMTLASLRKDVLHAADEIERLHNERDRMIEAMERVGKQSPEHRLLVQRVWREVNP